MGSLPALPQSSADEGVAHQPSHRHPPVGILDHEAQARPEEERIDFIVRPAGDRRDPPVGLPSPLGLPGEGVTSEHGVEQYAPQAEGVRHGSQRGKFRVGLLLLRRTGRLPRLPQFRGAVRRGSPALVVRTHLQGLPLGRHLDDRGRDGTEGRQDYTREGGRLRVALRGPQVVVRRIPEEDGVGSHVVVTVSRRMDRAEGGTEALGQVEEGAGGAHGDEALREGGRQGACLERG
mmetsp:Transcript_5182/g.14956  ORF Transcript_5182/g.14956 Transcript_5182/m.14956 type:complete len:234 (-) Transcript_5182:328-1029(-)